MNIAILGYGTQGQSALEYWNKTENTITVCDQNPVEGLPPGVDSRAGADYLNDLHQFDLLVRTPALHPSEILAQNTDHPEVMDKVTSVTNEFMRVCPAPIIGVTGTKGKGTTSTLIAQILAAGGHKVHLGGNIGIPPLELLKNNIQPNDWVVLELANFQLIDLQRSPHIAVCLMVAPEHLNWHHDMYEYVQAKQQLFVRQSKHDIAVYNVDNLYSEEIADISPALKLTYQVPLEGQEPEALSGAYVRGNHIYMAGTKVCNADDVRLPGRHNLQNVCAAIAATWHIIKGNSEVIKNVLQNFAGLEHRLQTIAEHNGVLYVDDSFGTTPETAIVAVQAFRQPKILIVGGSDKGADFNELGSVIASNNVKHVIAIGTMGPKIIDAIKLAKPSHELPITVLGIESNMTEIVTVAAAQAKKGEVVILSPACASFDMFESYKDRGEQFQAAIKALA